MAGRKIGLLIGNGSFGPETVSGFAGLRCPPNDVAGFARLLLDQKHGGFDEVQTLVDRPQQEVQIALEELLQEKAGFDDRVVIYYSGHGSPDGEGNLYLAAADSRKRRLGSTAVAMESLVRWMRTSKSQKIVLILDCCFSGLAGRHLTRGAVADEARAALPKADSATALYGQVAATGTRMMRELSGSGIYVLTASTETQVAIEKEGAEYGLLTSCILKGIEEGLADLDGDGIITMHELTMYVQQAVPREGRQEPLGFTHRGNGGELEIARTGRPVGPSIQQMREEVETAIWRSRTQFHVPLDVIQRALGLISEEAEEGAGESVRQLLAELHGMVGDDARFVRKLHGLVPRRPVEPVHTEPAPEPVWAAFDQHWQRLVRLATALVDASLGWGVGRWCLGVVLLVVLGIGTFFVVKRGRGTVDAGKAASSAPVAMPGGRGISVLWTALKGWPGALTHRNPPPAQQTTVVNPVAGNDATPSTVEKAAVVDGGTKAAGDTPGATAPLARYTYRTPDTGCQGAFVELPNKLWQDLRPGAPGCPELHFTYVELNRTQGFMLLQLSGFNEYRRLPVLSAAVSSGTVMAGSSVRGPWTVLWTVTLEDGAATK